MIASYRILFFAFLLLGTHACKLRTPGSSLFDDMPQGVRIESDPIQHNLEEIVRVGESNNFSYTHADLNAALTGGGDISKATSLLKSKYIYQQIEGVERMVGYMFYQIVD